MSRKKISTLMNLSRARDIDGEPGVTGLAPIAGATVFASHPIDLPIDLMTMQVDLHRGSR